MKSLDMLKQVDHSRKAAIYTAGHDGKLRNFAYTEELGECRETFSRLLHDVQEGEIGVILAPEAACLGIETSPGWMEAFIQAVKQHGVLIGDHGHDLVYDLREEEDADTSIYALSSGAIGQDVDLFGMGRWKEVLDILAPYGISHEDGWRPVPPERRDWLSRTQRQEDAMAAQAGAAMEPHRGSLPQGAHVSVILPRSGQARGNKRRRKRGGRNR